MLRWHEILAALSHRCRASGVSSSCHTLKCCTSDRLHAKRDQHSSTAVDGHPAQEAQLSEKACAKVKHPPQPQQHRDSRFLNGTHPLATLDTLVCFPTVSFVLHFNAVSCFHLLWLFSARLSHHDHNLGKDDSQHQEVQKEGDANDLGI